jgi:hypothetical protein
VQIGPIKEKILAKITTLSKRVENLSGVYYVTSLPNGRQV